MRRFRVLVLGFVAGCEDATSGFLLFGSICFASSISVVFTPGSKGKLHRLHIVRFTAGDLHQEAISSYFN